MIENTLSDVKLMLPDVFFAVFLHLSLQTINNIHYVAEFSFYLRKETIYFLLHI